MMGECTVAKPEASKASDLACTSCRLGRSQPLVATDCRQTKRHTVRQGRVGRAGAGEEKQLEGGAGGIQAVEGGGGVDDTLRMRYTDHESREAGIYCQLWLDKWRGGGPRHKHVTRCWGEEGRRGVYLYIYLTLLHSNSAHGKQGGAVSHLVVIPLPLQLLQLNLSAALPDSTLAP